MCGLQAACGSVAILMCFMCLDITKLPVGSSKLMGLDIGVVPDFLSRVVVS